MESRSDRRASLPSELRPNAWGRAGGSRHSSDGKERKATPSEEAAAVRSAKQLHVHQPGIVFVPGAKLQVQETIDNNWYDCKVVEVDWGELDILVHYQRWSDRFDEWLKMDSPRIRPVPAPRGPEQCPFHVGDSVVALWSVDHRYYPATVTRVINAQQCEVKFRDDNITKVLRCSQVHKLTGKEPASLLAPTRALAPPTVPAALPAAAAPPPAEGTSRKNIFDVNICDEKRKPKRKAEYTEMMEGMHKRRSLQGLISTRSTRQMSEKPPPLPCARVAPSTSSSSSTASSTAEASSAVAPPAPTASLPSSLATAAAASSASTSTSAPTTPRNSVTKAEKNASSKFPMPKRLPPPPLVIDNIDLTSSPDKGFKLRTTGANPTKEPNEFTRPVNEESPSARDSDAPKSASHLSSQSSSVSFLLPEKGTTVQPELKQSQQLLVTPKRATTTRPTALQLEVQHATHAPKLAKPVSTQSPLASKLSIKKNKAIKTPGSAKPSLLASLSTTRRAPMADDCMLSWEKHGCSVVKENSFPGWTKQYSRRQPYTGQDSWDAAYFAPDGSVLRNKRDLSAYAEDNALPCLVASFDFTAAGVKDAMLEHMKVCSVGTTKVGMSRTVALPSSSAPLTPTLPSSPIKTRSSGMSHKKSDSLAPETQTPSSSSYLSTQFTKSCPSTCPNDLPETCNIAASSREIAPVDDDYTHSRILDDSLKKLPPPPPLLSPPPTIPPPPHSPPAPPSPPPHLPVQSSPVASVSERKERETSAPSRTVSAVVSAGVDAAHAATAAVLQDEEHEAGVCSGESDEDNEQDVLSPQSQPNILTQTKVGLEDTSNSPAVSETPRRSVHLAPPGRFKIEIPIVLGRETSELERDVETPQPLTKSLPRTPPADAKSTPRSRLGAARRETKFVDSPSVSLEEHVCVVKNCNKTFRKHSLLQMHMKHYHPGTGDRLGSVPNVADLAYARTALGLLESGKTPSTDRRRKRHSLASPPESKRRKLEAVSRRKSTATLDAMEESDVGSVDTDSVDTRRVDLAHDSDWTADQESLAGDSSAAAALADQKFPVLDSESDEESDFVGFPSAPLPKTAPSPPSSHSLQRADAVDQSASADEGTSEESDEEATDVADEGDEVNVEDETGHRHIINCCCGSVEEDGLMLQCDVCMCWQHAQCYAIGKKAVPEKYVCSMCTNPDLVRSNHRFDHQVRNWLKEGAIPKFSFSSDDVGGGAQLEASVQRGHELSGALLQHSHLLHAVSVILAIAKKADHPKLVMWHKKWSDPRPPGFVPSILPLLPPPSTLQPFLPQVSGSLFPHSSSLTKDEAALIRDIIDMEPLMPPDKVLMQPDSMFGGVASLLPDSACIIGPPASVLNSSEMPPDGGRSSSPSLVLPRTPAPLTFPCEAPGFSTCTLPTSLLGSASFESLTSSSPGLSTSVKSTPVCSSNVFPSLSTAVSIINNFSASLPDVSTTNSLTSTDKLPSFPMATSDFSSPTVHASASSSITDSTLTSIISTKIPTLPSPCNMSNEVISKSSAPSSMPINLSADASAMLPMEVRDESIPPVPSPSLSAVVDSVSVSTSSSSPTCSSVLSVSGPPISEHQLTGDVSNSNSSRALHPVSSKEFVSTSVLSSATPDESDPIRDSLTSGYSDSVDLTSRPDSLSQNSQEVPVSNLVDQTALKVKDLNTPVSQTENIYDNKFTVEDSDNLKISEGVADEKLLSSKKDFPLETEKLSDETVKLPSEMSSRISEQQIVKKESFNANSKALYKSDVDEIKPINVNINEEEKISSSFGYDEFESLKVTPEKECSFKLSKDDKSPDKREVSFDLHLNLSSSEKGENSIIDEEVEAKSVKMCSLDVKTPRPEEIDDRLLPGAIPGSNHSVAEHGGASNALDICPAASVNQTTKASTSFTTVNAAEVSVISSPTSFGTIGMINSVTASSNIKSETHNEAPLIDVPNSISNDGEIQSTCSTLVHDLTYSSNSETTNNPETVTGTDGTENLYLGENADLDTSDLGLDLNELLLGNAAPSLDQFGIPNLTPGQTTHDIPGPSVPFPEAERIEPVKCKLNLLSHVQAAQDTLERVYDVIETEISKLEEQMGIKATEDEDSPGDTTSRQLVQMVLADMNIVERLSLYTG